MTETIQPRTRRPAPLPQVLTIPEAAKALGIGRDLAYRMAAEGRIPTLKLGRRLVVPKRRLLEMLGG